MWKQLAKRIGLILAVVLLSTGLSAQGDWKADFQRICGKADVAESLSSDELKVLVTESEELIKRIEKVDDPTKKMYILRLQKCRSLFAYMVDVKAMREPGKQ